MGQDKMSKSMEGKSNQSKARQGKARDCNKCTGELGSDELKSHRKKQSAEHSSPQLLWLD
jgi:hypothetical protein